MMLHLPPLADPNPDPRQGHLKRAPLGHFCRAPRGGAKSVCAGSFEAYSGHTEVTLKVAVHRQGVKRARIGLHRSWLPMNLLLRCFEAGVARRRDKFDGKTKQKVYLRSLSVASRRESPSIPLYSRGQGQALPEPIRGSRAHRSVRFIRPLSLMIHTPESPTLAS